mmetsp:Transcript_5566/g.6350  ORF Transcript_5566/g.6350 Transcript_5566/m.6350 type:complete len:472 (+) Transcript_5566:137-1552(+)
MNSNHSSVTFLQACNTSRIGYSIMRSKINEFLETRIYFNTSRSSICAPSTRRWCSRRSKKLRFRSNIIWAILLVQTALLAIESSPTLFHDVDEHSYITLEAHPPPQPRHHVAPIASVLFHDPDIIDKYAPVNAALGSRHVQIRDKTKTFEAPFPFNYLQLNTSQITCTNLYIGGYSFYRRHYGDELALPTDIDTKFKQARLDCVIGKLAFEYVNNAASVLRLRLLKGEAVVYLSLAGGSNTNFITCFVDNRTEVDGSDIYWVPMSNNLYLFKHQCESHLQAMDVQFVFQDGIGSRIPESTMSNLEMGLRDMFGESASSSICPNTLPNALDQQKWFMGLFAQLEGALGKFVRRDVEVYYPHVPLDEFDLWTFEQQEELMEEKQDEETSPLLFDLERNRFNSSNDDYYNQSSAFINMLNAGDKNGILGKVIDRVLNSFSSIFMHEYCHNLYHLLGLKYPQTHLLSHHLHHHHH